MVDGIILRPTTLTIASTLVALIVNTIFVLLNSLESICKFWITAISPKNPQQAGCKYHCLVQSVDDTNQWKPIEKNMLSIHSASRLDQNDRHQTTMRRTD